VAREFGRFEAVSRRRSISRRFPPADGEAGLDSKERSCGLAELRYMRKPTWGCLRKAPTEVMRGLADLRTRE